MISVVIYINIAVIFVVSVHLKFIEAVKINVLHLVI